MRLSLVLVLLVTSVSAMAHDELGNPNWIAKGQYTSPIDGSHCCGVADCVRVDPENVHEIKGGYLLRGLIRYGTGAGQAMQWLDETVPHREVQPSKDGNYWRCKKPDGSRRCIFIPPGAV